jgi:alpha-mannosidase
VEIHTEVDNTIKDHRLRVHFPAPFKTDHALHDGHFEIVKRPIGVPAWDDSWAEQPRPEVPQRAFTAIQEASLGLMVANRGLPEVEALNRQDGKSEIALTLLRCVGWLSRDDLSTRRGPAGPNHETPGAQLPGRHEFDYAIIPYANNEEEFLNACHQAYAFQTPLRAVGQTLHAGTLPPSASLTTVSSPEFVVSAVKLAEAGNQDDQARWIVRGYNLTNEPIQVRLQPWRPPLRVDLTNLAEIPQETLTLAEDGSVTIPAGPWQIKTVQWTSSQSG